MVRGGSWWFVMVPMVRDVLWWFVMVRHGSSVMVRHGSLSWFRHGSSPKPFHPWAQTLSYTHPHTPFTHGPDTDTHP